MKEIKIEALNTSIFIDDFSESLDGKIRIYDTNKNCLDYYEDISFESKQDYLTEIERLSSAKTVEELLSHFCLYESKDYIFVDDFEMGDTINIVGDKLLLFY